MVVLNMELEVAQPIAFDITIDAPPAIDITTASPEQVVALVMQPGEPGKDGQDGQPGQPGPPGAGIQIFGEVPAGAKDGTNTVFTTAGNYRAGSTAVYLNGLREFFYTETDTNEITLEDPPESTYSLRIDYTQEG